MRGCAEHDTGVVMPIRSHKAVAGDFGRYVDSFMGTYPRHGRDFFNVSWPQMFCDMIQPRLRHSGIGVTKVVDGYH
ncbi:MAG: hypothetical protein EAZ84_09890 [Verrucomicrobia bacterium]|nr:MAG: hypothetical protein EAZ84_09890 [Verrucomicrobiota bacterium]